MSSAKDFVEDVATRIVPRRGSLEQVVERARRRALRRRVTAAVLGLALTGALVAGLVATLARVEPRPADRPTPTPSREEGWSYVVVQSEGYVGDSLSMTVDDQGRAHLVYGGSGSGGEVTLDDGAELPGLVHAVVEDGTVTTSLVSEKRVGGGEATAVAVDASGTVHIAWTHIGLFYTNDADGSFAPPSRAGRRVHPGGMDMALADDGTPWIAFYGFDGMQVAHLDGGRWVVERIDRPELANPVLAGIATWRDEIFVAYGSGSETRLAHRRGDEWTVEIVDRRAGTAVDLAVDPDGEPTVAYVGRDEVARYAEPATGGGWRAREIPLGTSGFTAPKVVIDDAGAHHFAVYTASGVDYVTDAGGDLVAEHVPESSDWPFDIAVRGSTVYVAWQISSDAQGDAGDVAIATRSVDVRPDA